MRLVYISQGNIPSKWAHTFQAMKMAEAFGQVVPDFRLVTQVHWRRWLRGRFNFEEWYGIRHPFHIARLIRRGFPPTAYFDQVRFPDFDRAAVRYCLRRRPDLVYTRSEPAAEMIVKAGLPTIVETHADIGHWTFPHILSIKDSPHLKGIVTISDVLQSQFLTAGLRPEQILVCPDAVDAECFAALPPKGDLRRSLGLPEHASIALYCGHLYANRGIEEIVAAARVLPAVQFLLIGGWDKDVKARRDQSRDLPNVRFLGFVHQRMVPSYLAAADLLLMPYSAACPTADWMSPLKLFEYMASSIPIVASDLPAIRRHLQDGRNAVLVPADDGVVLAAGIKRLLSSPAAGARLAEAARADVLPFSWRKRAEVIMKTFCMDMHSH